LFSSTAQTATGTFVAPANARLRGRAATFQAIAPAPPDYAGTASPRTPHSLSLFSFTKKANEVAQTRRIGLQRVAMGWCLLAAVLAVTGFASLWLFVRLRWVLLVHGLGLCGVCVLLPLSIMMLGRSASSSFGVVGARLAMMEAKFKSADGGAAVMEEDTAAP